MPKKIRQGTKGCKKAGRNRKSPSMVRYTYGERWKVNRERRIKQEQKRKQRNNKKIYKVPRGTTRKNRRHSNTQLEKQT